MSANWKNRMPLAVLALLLVAGLVVLTRWQPAQAQEEKAAAGRYSVVMTEGHNLLVSDNGANKLYFYTIDKDAPIGSPLKLRASIDLTKVGQEEIRITPHNLEKFEPKKDK